MEGQDTRNRFYVERIYIQFIVIIKRHCKYVQAITMYRIKWLMIDFFIIMQFIFVLKFF